jgi:hypothetical protein
MYVRAMQEGSHSGEVFSELAPGEGLKYRNANVEGPAPRAHFVKSEAGPFTAVRGRSKEPYAEGHLFSPAASI